MMTRNRTEQHRLPEPSAKALMAKAIDLQRSFGWTVEETLDAMKYYSDFISLETLRELQPAKAERIAMYY